MKKYNTLYYLLFVLIVMGAFASMAQNDYGILILGLAALSFGLIFLVQLISLTVGTASTKKTYAFELISLSTLAFILAMRVFFIRFEFVEIVFGVAGFTLTVVYLRNMVQQYTVIHKSSKQLGLIILLFYGSIILYLVSMVTVPFFPSVSEPAGMTAFALLIMVGILSLIFRQILVSGEKTSGFQFILRMKDRTGVLMVLFLLFTAYMGLTKVGALPKMYSDEFPKAYFQLVNQAETGNEKPVNGKFKHEEFKEKYDRFIERNKK